MKAKNTFFQSWAKNMVIYGLDAGLGQFFMNAPETSCLYQLGNLILSGWSGGSGFVAGI